MAPHTLNPSRRMSRQNQQISWRCVFSSRDYIRILGRVSVSSISISQREWTRENSYPPLQLTHGFAPSPARTVKHCTVVVFVGQYTYNELASICTSRIPPSVLHPFLLALEDCVGESSPVSGAAVCIGVESSMIVIFSPSF